MTTTEELRKEADERLMEQVTGFPVDASSEAGFLFLVGLGIVAIGAFLAAVISVVMLLP